MILEWSFEGQKQSRWLSPGVATAVGRGANCAITIAHPTVSRRHAEVLSQGANIQVRNLSQSNPIVIEHYGQIFHLGPGQQMVVPVGAQLHLGEIAIQVKEPTVLRVRCPGPCGKVVAVQASGFCPNCGTALATADTFVG